MWLQYAVTSDGELLSIDQVGRGKLNAFCPYCGGQLLAKKGNVKVHHFAHAGETCRAVQRDVDISLPCFDNFHLHIPGKLFEALKDFAFGDGTFSRGTKWLASQHQLEAANLIHFNEFAGRNGDWELAKPGRLALGQLSLMLFNQYQEPLIVERYEQLHEAAEKASQAPALRAELEAAERQYAALLDGRPDPYGEQWREINWLNQRINELRYKINTTPDLSTALADLRLYTAQWKRILSTTLYFLEIKHAGGLLHKIGVTTRPVEERIAEIRADLLPHVGPVEIAPLGTWPHRGNVELYFKYRYQAHQQPIGTLTEYYVFDDVKTVLRDLRRMKPKELTPLESDILAGKPARFEQRLLAEAALARRKEAIRAGMKEAAKRGQHIGRPSEDEAAFMAKPQVQAVKAALLEGLSLRQAAARTGVAINTVRKVKALIETNE